MPQKVRYQLFVPLSLSERLEALAAKPGATRSALLAQALESWLDRRGTSELDERFGVRLDRISSSLARIERGQEILLESLALFIRYELAIHAPLAENDHAGRALARERFEAFVSQVGRQLAAGKRTLAPATESER
ncbi:CopG family transcriptional regulator [Sphingomonas canadensis]|uniref:CopG family transcriptional regulator n=1 Tax=Sphingomonas canadensis TaxID=1219257 RepID=A0ABW3H0U1_9SPHN|nr:CopG family transcriptional regulator [Sphingomonas canadensis]MCW3835055.1 CopG family transcriptional regulator [Sphingomonas canadensis]